MKNKDVQSSLCRANSAGHERGRTPSDMPSYSVPYSRSENHL